MVLGLGISFAIISIIVGVLILFFPDLLRFIIGIYLILVGILTLV